MIISRTTMSMDLALGTELSSLSPSRIPSALSVRLRVDKGKGKSVARKPWVDGPWPLIEPPSRTQRVSHAAHHIANEIATTHNAMLRGLNALYLQAPFVHKQADIADFLFLTQAWSGWVSDHHEMKESTMIPSFESVLGLEAGSLFSTQHFRNGDEGVDEGGRNPQDIPALLLNLCTYAAETHPQPSSYSPSTLQALLASVACVLVPHLHNQIPVLVQMSELCTPSPSPSSSVPPSPPKSPSPTPPSPKSPRSPTRESYSPPTPARPPPESDSRGTSLSQAWRAAEAALAEKSDRYTVPPMAMRLRDAGFDGGGGPQLSVPAVHAVADRLSPRHAGAWRFLPCDVWGRPRGLEFLGE
ncbi:hypothetical protein F4804DRAFT_154181 [Jackrogersella minutella]|nr:hypothetical protein F4804DRAFT_154181 [Jackrogersella minutella]